MAHRRILYRTVSLTILLAIALFMLAYLGQLWRQLSEAPLQIDWSVLALSQGLMVAGLLMLPIVPYRILGYLKSPLPAPYLCRLYFLSNLAKYLPGGVWALPGRAFLYQRAGTSVAASAAGVLWEVALLVAAAAIMSILGLRLLLAYIPVWLVISAVIVTLSALVVSAFMSGRLRRLLPEALRDILQNNDLKLTVKQSVGLIAINMLTWLIIGLAFAIMVYSLHPSLAVSVWFELIGLYAGAWLVGFLIVVTPGGIGVRDGLLAAGLAVLFDAPLPVAIALIARIVWTLAEVVCLLIASILQFQYARHRHLNQAQF
jgi:hypothetical protein